MNALAKLSNNIKDDYSVKYSGSFPKKQHSKISFFIHPSILQDMDGFFSKITEVQREVLEYLFWLDAHCKCVRPSQSTIAKRVGATRQYVNQILGELQDVGILQKIYRHMRPCFYIIAGVFKNPFITKRLASYFNVFKLQSYLLLTQYNNNLNRYKSYIYMGAQNNSNRSRDMSEPSPFSSYLEEVAPKLQLTLAGKVRLSAFPDEALKHVVHTFDQSRHKLTGDYGRWLWGCARNYCQQLSLVPNWRYSNELAVSFGITLDSPLVYRRSTQQQTITSDKESQPTFATYQPTTLEKPTPKPTPIPKKTRFYKPYTSQKPVLTIEEPSLVKAKIQKELERDDISPFARMLLEKYSPPCLKHDEDSI
jgi:hypothetical protein